MLFDKFKESNRVISAREIVEAVEETKLMLHKTWETSLSNNSDGREELYRQVKGIDTVMMKLISDKWGI